MQTDRVRSAARTMQPILFLLLAITLLQGCRDNSRSATEHDLTSFEIAPGFKIELLVAEPLIRDPVDMEIDEYGRLYVVEMPGYPLDKSGTGKIKLLTDADGDGKIETSSTFIEGLILPNSIMRWKKGVIVTDAPNVLYLEDADNDGRAEIIDTLLTGFALSNPQHNLNSPLLGIDNWIYLGHEDAVTTDTYTEEFGDPGRAVYYPEHPDGPRLGINADGRSVRFRPDHNLLEPVSGRTQFGHTFDAWGHHFLVGNANHVFHEVIAEPYLRRNRNLLIADATQSMSDHGNAAEVFPITLNPQHQLLTDVGVITSACGLTAYLGGSFPPPFDKNVTFVAEPVSNLIHVDRISDNGASFIASRIFPNKEFLASKDAKFRPVNLYAGPDGALYVVDYYRQIIEHPEWMDQEVIESGELYNDSDKGRIYRISPTNAGAADWMKGLTLGDLPAEQLVQMLANPNHWWRHNAQRLLVDRADRQVASALLRMGTNAASATGRLHALWTLEGMGELKPELIQQALNDSVAGIRENAIRLAELHLSDAPQLVGSLLELEHDADAKVRYQLLCTLGFIDSPSAVGVRRNLLFKDIEDKWFQVAALSASSLNAADLLNELLAKYRDDVPAYGALIQRVSSMVVASGDRIAVRQIIQKALSTYSEGMSAALEGVAMGMENTVTEIPLTANDEDRLISACIDHPSLPVRKASVHLLEAAGIKNIAAMKEAIPIAARIAGDRALPAGERALVLEFMALGDPARHAALLKSLIVPREQLSVQVAALKTLSSVPDNTISQYLMEQWPSLTPEIQDAAINTFLVNGTRVALLLDAVESGRIPATSISWPRKVGLMQFENDTLKAKARSLFTSKARAGIQDAYKQALSAKGDAVTGKTIFVQNCSLCHQVRGEMGEAIGPDLGTVHNWSAEAVMENTLSPNLSISSGFDTWSVELLNNETVTGVIASETPGAITIRNAGGFERTIGRHDIKSLKALNMSLMPEGMEAQISPEQMVDLVAFLKGM